MRPREFASIELHLAGHRPEGPRSALFQAPSLTEEAAGQI
jgi:hypothetical protein